MRDLEPQKLYRKAKHGGYTHGVPVLQRQRQENPSAWLASQFSLIGDLQIKRRSCLKGLDGVPKDKFQGCLLNYTCTYIHVNDYIHGHPSIHEYTRYLCYYNNSKMELKRDGLAVKRASHIENQTFSSRYLCQMAHN